MRLIDPVVVLPSVRASARLPAAWAATAAIGCIVALMVTAAGTARAQAGPAAEGPPATVSVPAPAASAEGLAAQARMVVERIRSGDLSRLDDGPLLAFFNALPPEIYAAYLQEGAAGLRECEIWMRREERIGGVWTDPPFLNLVKYRERPRQVYIKWLKGGSKAGQEILYDETRRTDAMLGHLGGLLGVVSSWVPLDSSMARSNSNHSVKELGPPDLAAIFVRQAALDRAAGRRPVPQRVEIGQAGGQRTVAVTWVAPSGSAEHYAARTRIQLDLQQPRIRQIEAWNDKGELMERILFEKVVPTRFGPADFDPENPAYGF